MAATSATFSMWSPSVDGVLFWVKCTLSRVGKVCFVRPS